ncbi:melanoma-associated antigen 10-like [Carlito syrichta]|uniref:Melanoma-associated antigen 10-like n=1 Tax=Carlito syrichta TaxID=1868482 RepID=A0A1U7TJM4_CARSF|nr:melanoma-associated antigen 10-like [Carlito syrichta]
MSRAPKRRRYMLEEEFQSQSETQDIMGAHVSPAVEEDASSSSSTCSSSFPSSFPSSSSSSSSSSWHPLILSTPEEVSADAETPSTSQSSQSACSYHTGIASTFLSQSDESSSSPKEESPSTLQTLPDTEPLPRNEIDEKVGELVEFLLHKYRTKEPVAKAEMLSVVIKNYENHFPEIFREAAECMRLIFGLDMKEVDPTNHSFILVTSLGLSYDGMQGDDQGNPKIGLLINVLSLIFTEGNRTPEEVVWEALSKMGVCVGKKHCIYGEPRKLLTQEWVQEQYLEYQQVPGSDPARYEFLWGPRAHTEVSKMNLLKFLVNIRRRDPRSFPVLYEEALRDEEERAQASIVTTDDATAMASASSSATSCLFYPE